MALPQRVAVSQAYQPGQMLNDNSEIDYHVPMQVYSGLTTAASPFYVNGFTTEHKAFRASPPGLAIPAPPGLHLSRAQRRAQRWAGKPSRKGADTPPAFSSAQVGSDLSSSCSTAAEILSDTDTSTAVDQDGRESSGDSSADIASDQALRSYLPFTSSEDFALGSPQCPTIGSKDHRLGHTCKPCPFVICESGVDCKFCHLCECGIAHLHLTGNCRPCLFAHKPEGCKSGADCNFCHFQHDSRTSHRRHLRGPRVNRRGKGDAEQVEHEEVAVMCDVC